MVKRTDIEKREAQMLSPFACLSCESKGRVYPESSCELRTDFQRDRDRIIHTKAFRRLKHKTQVFLAPEGDHFRTRLTHTLEVAQISRTIARGLALNEDLTEAIALGHDLGHTPFGHNGEMILNKIYPKGFKHNEQSLRVVDVLEQGVGSRGMNLTEEVRNGILHHNGSVLPFTLEGQVVKIGDRIAYINHDIDDALRSGVIKEEDLPQDCVDFLGKDHRSRINRLVMDMIEESDGKPQISMSKEAWFFMDKLRKFMFREVYYNKQVKKDSDLAHVEKMIGSLYRYYCDHWQELPEELLKMREQSSVEEMSKDHIAGMTDRYAQRKYQELFLE